MYTCQNCSKKLKISLINMGSVPVANHLLLKKDQHYTSVNKYSRDYEVQDVYHRNHDIHYLHQFFLWNQVLYAS